jgi:hypothetical protein
VDQPNEPPPRIAELSPEDERVITLMEALLRRMPQASAPQVSAPQGSPRRHRASRRQNVSKTSDIAKYIDDALNHKKYLVSNHLNTYDNFSLCTERDSVPFPG